MERLTEKQIDGTYHIYGNNMIRKASCCDENNKNWFSLYEGNAIDKLGRYEDLEEQGRLIKLPCKVGDMVYVISSRCNGEEIDDEWCKTHDCDNCAFVYETKATKYLLYQLWKGNNKTYIFGKTIFLTKAEAEKALAEMGE